MISKRIMEMYASRQVSVKGSYNEIPMVINDHVKREIQSFQTVERDFFIESYKRSGRFRADMAKALKEAGIPEEISWLPLIESGFKTQGTCRARAHSASGSSFPRPDTNSGSKETTGSTSGSIPQNPRQRPLPT